MLDKKLNWGGGGELRRPQKQLRDSQLKTRRRLSLENLEERALLAVIAGAEIAAALEPVSETLVVTTLADTVDDTDGVLSLREAVAAAEAGDTVTFDASLAGGTIVLSGTELTIDKGITIDASSIGGMTINANQASRVLNISGGTEETPVKFLNLTITGGNAYLCGGIYNESGNLTLMNCVITQNTSNSSSIYHGRGICNEAGTLTLTDCSITKNSAFEGGGISNYGTALLTNCLIDGNTATNGGGIYGAGYFTLTNSKVTNNNVGSGGGGIYSVSSDFTLSNSVISKNVSGLDGGGILTYSKMTLFNSIITENSANRGGGVANYGTTTQINCTIAGNSAKYNCGGIYNNHLNATGTYFLYNSIVAQNTTSGSDKDIYVYSGKICGHNNLSSLVGWSEADSGNNDVYDSSKPLFTDAENGDWTLADDSQAIDVGCNDYVTAAVDLAENARLVGNAVDMGAYEYQISQRVVTTLADVVDDTDGVLSLREAIAVAASGETITFDASLAGGTITLNGTELTINKEIIINASLLNGGITLDAHQASRVLHIVGKADETVSVNLLNLTITGGKADDFGGGIYNEYSSLTLTNCKMTANTANAGGGVYNNEGTLTLTNCAIIANTASAGGEMKSE